MYVICMYGFFTFYHWLVDNQFTSSLAQMKTNQIRQSFLSIEVKSVYVGVSHYDATRQCLILKNVSVVQV